MERALSARIALVLGSLASCAPTLPNSSAPLTSTDTHSSGIVRFSAECEDWDEWEKPAKPFQIYANTYYVGSCGISAILIQGGYGHVLIDTGTREGAEAVLDNIRTLGLNPVDVEMILHSHEHFDHVGGLAFVRKTVGASVVASQPAADALYSGKATKDDPQFGMHEPMDPEIANQIVENGDAIILGDLRFIAVATPGHAPGALTWQWNSCNGDDCKTVVYADSMGPVSSDSYRFSDNAEYLKNYRAGIHRVRALDCDILLTPHPSASNMIERAATGTLEGGMTCVEYADAVERSLDARLAEEAAGE